MIKNEKGFTLVELLAVIVILGLLMAIAIPSVTKYITESRKKTLTTTISNYISALENEVNDLTFSFINPNTIYAVPIECISLERGGTSPFGEWYQANDAYWAYILVQYDDENSKYIYGFTFKDSAGYGMQPTAINMIKENGKQIKNELNLKKPESGSYLNIALEEEWNGFHINDETALIVLEALKEGVQGDGQTTCTLTQKGNNYAQLEEPKENYIYDIVKSSVVLGKSKQYVGLGYRDYSKNVYFYNDTETNNVLFADYCWKIIRTTDTGGVKLIYNGEPDDGTCDNSGSQTQIGREMFNEYSSSLADIGYMNGTAYEYDKQSISSTSHTTTPVHTLYIGQNTSWRYYTNISYSNGTYYLSGSYYSGYWKNNYNRVNGYYTCRSTATSCTQPFYIIKGLNNARAYGHYLQNGKLRDDYSTTLKLSSTITNNDDGSYTLNNPTTITFYDFYANNQNYNNYYLCPDYTSTTCENARYITQSYGDSYYFITLKAYIFGNSYQYKNGKYILENAVKYSNIANGDLENRHYTCFENEEECEIIYYIYNIEDGTAYYIALENGNSIESAKTAMLSDNEYNSIIKDIVDEWYASNMTSYTSKIEDTVYCNNRSIVSQNGWSPNNNDFSTHLKFYSFDEIDLTCNNKADRFTVSSNLGNGKLTYPVGLITAPEAMLWQGNASGSKYWTMTPFGYGEAAAHNFQVFEDGRVDFDRVTFSNGVRPVISLKSMTVISGGDGTVDNPYTIE